MNEQVLAISARARTDGGKGASRRLRHTGQVPGIVYGGHKAPQMIAVAHNELERRLEHEAFYSSLLDLDIDGEPTKVVLKDLQRHPARPFILHVDFQRVSMEEKLKMTVPLHFENEATAKGIKMGGKATHNVTEVEVTCLPQDLPEFIVVDMAAMDIGDVVHVSDLKLPAGVELTAGMDMDAPVVVIHAGFGGAGDDETGEGAAGEGSGS